MTLEQIPRPLNRPKSEEEKAESKFDQPVDMISGGFLDGFIRENIDLIRSESGLGIIEQNLAAGINKLVGEAIKERGEEFAIRLERYLVDDLKNYRYLIPDTENDSLVKKQAMDDLLRDLEERGVIIDEDQL